MRSSEDYRVSIGIGMFKNKIYARFFGFLAFYVIFLDILFFFFLSFHIFVIVYTGLKSLFLVVHVLNLDFFFLHSSEPAARM